LYDYGARFYDPALGRFISADTVVPGAGNPQALNRYAYVRNNPLRYTDPTGHMVDPGGPTGKPKKKPPPGEPGVPVPEWSKNMAKGCGIGALIADSTTLAISGGGALVELSGFAAGLIEPSPGGGETVGTLGGVSFYYIVMNPVENLVSSGGTLLTATGDVFSGYTYFDIESGELVIGQDTMVSSGALAIGNQPILPLEGGLDTVVNTLVVVYDAGRMGERIPTVMETRVGFKPERGGLYWDMVVYGDLARRLNVNPGTRLEIIRNLGPGGGWVLPKN